MQEIKWRDLTSPRVTPRSQVSWTERKPHIDLYQILEVSCTACPEVIRAAYRALMEKHHPDKNPEHMRRMAEEVSCQLNQAYAVLSDPEQRRNYDRLHGISRKI